jgi:BirA family transcriptional regulator, biotin operon repressor / biotin---[acetyl-CoA-carboxylase] ligase
MKNRILSELKANSSRYISGEALSETLGVSRTIVWRYICELKGEGYAIDSSPRKGYKLLPSFNILNEYEINCGLNTKVLGKDLRYFGQLDSTNNYAKKIANEGCPDGTVVVAACQTAGKGRLGREWNSMSDKGVWFSVVLRPKLAPGEVQVVTLAASVSVASSIERVTGIKAGIKWPNDIIIRGKKVCGILTEMSSEIDRINYLVIGIGINVNHSIEDFPEELKDTATSLRISVNRDNSLDDYSNSEAKFDRSELIREVLHDLEEVFKAISCENTAGILDKWRDYSVTLNRNVRIYYKDSEYKGVARDITPDGRLVVECSDGVVRKVVSGEVSVRGLLGYL